MEYAPTGYLYHSVQTPSFFKEALLREDPERDTPLERKARERLEDAAEIHRTYIITTTYRLG